MRDLTAKRANGVNREAGASAARGGEREAGTAYRITVKGIVDDRWSAWFEGLHITHDTNGDTTLAGTVRDQAALHGLFAKVRDLGLTLLTVEPRPPESIRTTTTAADPRVRRHSAALAGVSLLVMAILAPLARFGVLNPVLVSGDAGATVRNIATSSGPFMAAIAALLVVAVLDVAVAVGLDRFFRPVDERMAKLVAALRVAYAGLLAVALVNLVAAAQVVSAASPSALDSAEFQARVQAALGSFTTGWDLALALFGFHLAGLGILLVRASAPRWLAALVAAAGVGYVADAFLAVLVPGMTFKVGTVTFVGEVLLMLWLLRVAIRGVPSSDDARPDAAPAHSSEAAAIRAKTWRSPAAAIVGSVGVGLALAVALVLGPASGGTEATITGSIMLAFGIGWGVMAFTTTRVSSRPQSWMLIPAAGLGLVGLSLVVSQPGHDAMGLLGWLWPPALAALGIWMVVQTRANLRGRARWVLLPVVAVLVAVSIGGAITTVASAADQRQAQTGQFIDVGGRELYIECHGTGSPAVVLQAGMNASAADFSRIAPTVATSTTVCAYDRAGHGWSDAAPTAQDGTEIAADLHTLLERASIAGPYVLVGHSSGGPYMRVFAASYPDQVAGMVLLDAQPADAFTALPDYPAFYGPYRAVITLAPSLARVGLGIPLLGSPADPHGVRTASSMRDEVVALPEALEQAQALTTIGDRPLIVVSAGTDQQAGWLTAQEHLVQLSANVAHRVIPSATHESVMVGADAAASSQAIVDVVAAVRSGGIVR